MSIVLIKDLIRKAFSDKNPTIINAKEFKDIPLEEWQYINDSKIRYKITLYDKERCISITEWLEDDTFLLHTHDDADEVIFIIRGWLHSLLDNLKRHAFQKIFYKAGTMHELKGGKGTLIAVEFKFI